MNAYDRLLLEAIPVRPAPAPYTSRPASARSQWTPAEQDWHWQELADGLGIPCEPRPAHHEPGKAAP